MKRVVCLRVQVFLWFILFYCASVATAAERIPVSLKVLPMHVGVFYEIKTQQFQAIATFADGSKVDYTEKVGWSLKAYPFSNQTKKPDQIARINKKGLLTVLNTWGRVKVVATYPPPVKFSPSAISIILLSGGHRPPVSGRRSLPAILGLLLLSDEKKVGTVTVSSEAGTTAVITGQDILGSAVSQAINVEKIDAKVVEPVIFYNKDNQRIELVRFFRYTGNVDRSLFLAEHKETGIKN